MSGISKCSGENCPLKETCKRFTSTPSLVQSYINFKYNKEQKNCEFYYENK